MNDVYVEWLIKRKSTLSGILLRALSIVLIVGCVFVFLFFGIIGLILEMIACYLAFFIFRMTSVEYEYIYLSGELGIDKVMGKSKRKKLARIDMSTVEVVAPVGHDELSEYKNKKCLYKDYTSLMNLNTVYSVYYRKDSDLLKIDFEPNSKIMEAMQLQSPRKVFIQN